METLAVIALGWAVGGFVNGMAGFGAAMAAMPLVASYMDMTIAVPSCTLITLALNSQMGWSLRRHMEWGRIRPLLLGALPGAALGVTLLRSLPEGALKAGMGGFLLVYAVWGLGWGDLAKRNIPHWWGGLAGLLATLFGTAFGFNGPPLAAYVSMCGWAKDVARATLVAGFVGTGAIMVATQAVAGLYTPRALLVSAVAIPAVVAGGRLGLRASARLGERGYRRMVYVLLLCMGATILWN